MDDREKGFNKKIKGKSYKDPDFTFYFKDGERTKAFDDAMIEISGHVNKMRKERLENEKRIEEEDSSE